MLLRELFEAKARNVVAVMPGGFHPFHPGHKSLYDWAVKTFGKANVYVAATNDQETRPFPFEVKKKLAAMAGVPESNFMQVRSPFNNREYSHLLDDDTALVFVRSEKDKNEEPLPDRMKIDRKTKKPTNEPRYLRSYTGKNVNTHDEMGYMAYGPTINFDFSGMQIKSASELRATWPEMSDEDKLKAAKLMYGNGAEAAVQLLNKALGDTEAPVGEILGFARHTPKRDTVTKKKEKFDEPTVADKIAARRKAAARGDKDAWSSKKEIQTDEADAVNKRSMAGDTKSFRYTTTGGRLPTSDTSKPSDITKKAKQVDMPNDTIDDFDFSGVDGAKLKKVVARLVSELPGSPKNIKVLQARFGLAPFQKAYTLQQVADAMGVTPEVVRQREAKAIRMLKHPSRSRELRPFLDESNPFTDARMNAIKANESMIEKAPPGREKQVKALKKKFDDPGAPYAIAWAQHNKKKK